MDKFYDLIDYCNYVDNKLNTTERGLAGDYRSKYHKPIDNSSDYYERPGEVKVVKRRGCRRNNDYFHYIIKSNGKGEIIYTSDYFRQVVGEYHNPYDAFFMLLKESNRSGMIGIHNILNTTCTNEEGCIYQSVFERISNIDNFTMVDDYGLATALSSFFNVEIITQYEFTNNSHFSEKLHHFVESFLGNKTNYLTKRWRNIYRYIYQLRNSKYACINQDTITLLNVISLNDAESIDSLFLKKFTMSKFEGLDEKNNPIWKYVEVSIDEIKHSLRTYNRRKNEILLQDNNEGRIKYKVYIKNPQFDDSDGYCYFNIFKSLGLMSFENTKFQTFKFIDKIFHRNQRLNVRVKGYKYRIMLRGEYSDLSYHEGNLNYLKVSDGRFKISIGIIFDRLNKSYHASSNELILTDGNIMEHLKIDDNDKFMNSQIGYFTGIVNQDYLKIRKLFEANNVSIDGIKSMKDLGNNCPSRFIKSCLRNCYGNFYRTQLSNRKIIKAAEFETTINKYKFLKVLRCDSIKGIDNNELVVKENPLNAKQLILTPVQGNLGQPMKNSHSPKQVYSTKKEKESLIINNYKQCILSQFGELVKKKSDYMSNIIQTKVLNIILNPESTVITNINNDKDYNPELIVEKSPINEVQQKTKCINSYVNLVSNNLNYDEDILKADEYLNSIGLLDDLNNDTSFRAVDNINSEIESIYYIRVASNLGFKIKISINSKYMDNYLEYTLDDLILRKSIDKVCNDLTKFGYKEGKNVNIYIDNKKVSKNVDTLKILLKKIRNNLIIKNDHSSTNNDQPSENKTDMLGISDKFNAIFNKIEDKNYDKLIRGGNYSLLYLNNNIFNNMTLNFVLNTDKSVFINNGYLERDYDEAIDEINDKVYTKVHRSMLSKYAEMQKCITEILDEVVRSKNNNEIKRDNLLYGNLYIHRLVPGISLAIKELMTF